MIDDDRHEEIDDISNLVTFAKLGNIHPSVIETNVLINELKTIPKESKLPFIINL